MNIRHGSEWMSAEAVGRGSLREAHDNCADLRLQKCSKGCSREVQTRRKDGVRTCGTAQAPLEEKAVA